MKTQRDGWTKKSKGTARIYTHPDAFEGRAVVENSFGVTFNGERFQSVETAKAAALTWSEFAAFKNGGAS